MFGRNEWGEIIRMSQMLMLGKGEVMVEKRAQRVSTMYQA